MYLDGIIIIRLVERIATDLTNIHNLVNAVGVFAPKSFLECNLEC